MKFQFNIIKKLWFNFGFQLTMQLLIAGTAYWAVNQLSQGISKLTTIEIPALSEAGLLDMYHDGLRGIAMEAIVQTHMNQKNRVLDLQKEASEMSQEMKVILKHLSELALESDIKTLAISAEQNVNVYIETVNSIIESCSKESIAEAESKIPILSEKFEILEQDLGAITDSIKNESTASNKRYTDFASYAFKLNIGIVIFTVIVGLLASLLLVRSLSITLEKILVRIKKESDLVDRSAANISTSSNTLSEAAQEQSASVHETVATLDEINAMVKRGVDHAVNTNNLSQESLKVARDGKQAAVDLLRAVKDIDATNSLITKHMTESNKSISEIALVINEISEKTKVINDIVFQTKLLSFNASVEAARAGEHGKGFAVVAEEVGNLAQMSGNAAEDIRKMLDSSVSKVEGIVEHTKSQTEKLVQEGRAAVAKGAEKSEFCGSTLDEVVNNIERVVGMMSELSNAAEEQYTGVNNISSAMNQFTQVTDSNIKVANESLELSRELKSVSVTLTEHIQSLVVAIGLKQNKSEKPIGSGISKLDFEEIEDQTPKAA